VLEEAVQPEEVPVAVPYQRFLLRCQFIPGLMNGKVEFVGTVDEPVLPLLHYFPAPAGYGIVIDREIFIRDDQALVYPYYFPVALADRACSQRRVEAEEMLCRLLEGYTVFLEPVREPHRLGRLLIGHGQVYFASSRQECRLHRVGRTTEFLR